ncbi:RNA-directed DNA polymerase, eukaryota, reverse transcriptase zinc-binding domain protein, partial [Tanacetum coccineum]
KSRNHVVISDEEVETERVEVLAVNGEGGDDTYCPSMEYKDYDTEFPLLNKKNELNNKDCNNKELNKENVKEANYCNYDKCVNSNNIKEVTEPEGTDCYVETGINDCCNNNCDDANKNDREMESNRYKTFASMLRSNNDEIENKLNLIPLCVENGREKWDPDVVIDRSEPKTLPCWIKLHNVPLEAWTSNGISSIASGLGKPLVMDKTTAKMCRGGIEYNWKPPKCCECKVFGHTENTCGLKSGNECNADKGVWNKKNDEEDNGFRKIRYGNKIIKPAAKIGNGLGQGKPQGTKVGKTRLEYRPVNKQTTNNQTPSLVESKHNVCFSNDKEKTTQSPKRSVSLWRISKENIEELRRSENKFSILEEIHDCEDPMEQLQIDKEISDRGCRIIVGWNEDDVNVNLIHSTKQTMLCLVEIKDSKCYFFCCFVYADNSGKERKILWKDLKDHPKGGSSKTCDMIEFQECLEHIEVEDINCSGIHFTWVQSRQNPNSGILKKIDRELGNVKFMSKFPNSHALFLPHLTFDHSPAVLIFPKVMNKNHKAFRFSNFIADKPDFLSIVQEN